MGDTNTQGAPGASGPTQSWPGPAVHLAVHGNGNRITIAMLGPGGTCPSPWHRARGIIVNLAIMAGATSMRR
jgi:hypothetical protein